MGTSSSSKGPGTGVPFDPPWLDRIPSPLIPGEDLESLPKTPTPSNISSNEDLAPPARFLGARRNLNNYIHSGNRESLNRALGHYSRKGMGGSSVIANRMIISTRTAAGLLGFFNSVSSGNNSALKSWIEGFTSKGASAREIADGIVDIVGPNGGSLDEISAQNSLALAFEDLLTEHPEVNLLSLTESSIWSLLGSYLGYELFNRIYLDIGQCFENSKLTAIEAESRKEEMRTYIISDVTASLNIIRKTGTNYSKQEVNKVFREVLFRTINIYEGALE